MSLPKIYKGSDEVILITLQDADSVAIPPSGLDDVIVTCYQTKENIIEQWRMSDGDVIIEDDVAGIVKVYLDRSNTEKIELRRVYLEVALEETDANFESGTKRTIQSDIPLCDILNSVT